MKEDFGTIPFEGFKLSSVTSTPNFGGFSDDEEEELGDGYDEDYEEDYANEDDDDEYDDFDDIFEGIDLDSLEENEEELFEDFVRENNSNVEKVDDEDI